MSGEANNALFCWEAIDRNNRLFRITHPFAPVEVAERLVPLYALFASVESICSGGSDEVVVARKLDWWRGALRFPDEPSRDHPVIAELARTGAAERISDESVSKWVDLAAWRVDGPSVRDVEMLGSICRAIGEAMATMESAVCGVPEVMESLPAGTAVRIGLMQLLRESLAATGDNRLWWAPLDFLARHGLQRQVLQSGNGSEARRLLCGYLQSLDGVTEPVDAAEISDISIDIQQFRHMFVFDALLVKRLNHTKLSSYIFDGKKLFQTGLGDLLTCWQAARRFNRRR